MSTSSKFKSLFTKNNIILLIISIVVAIVLWGLIITYVDPDTTFVVKDVPVQINTSSQDATSLSIVSGNIDFVDVEVSVPRSEIPSLDASSFTAEIDLTNETLSGTYPKKIEVSTSVGFAKILSVTPSDVTITLDITDSRTFTIEVDDGGYKAPDGYYLGKSSLSNSELTITGPKSLLDEISNVVVNIEIDEGTTGVVPYKDCPLKLVDAEGQELSKEHLNLLFDTVTVSVPILRTKTVPLSVDFINCPDLSKDYCDVTYYVDNKKIEEIDIAVTDDKYDEVNELSVGKIDFSSINSKKYSQELVLEMPAGVTNASGIDSVTVTLNFKGVMSSSILFDANDIVKNNIPAGKDAVVTSRTVRVSICGSAESVGLAQNEARASVDLSGTESGGIKEYPLLISFGELQNVWVYVADNLTPPTVNVEIK